MSLVFLVAVAGCSFDITLGAGDVAPFHFEQSIPNPALAKTGDVVLDRDVDLVSAERSQRFLDKLGPSKIGALREVSLTVVDFHIDGVDLAAAGPAMLTIAGQTMVARPGESVALDDSQVAWLRARLLRGEAVGTTLGISLRAPVEALDASAPVLHIVLVLQPTLVIDAASAL